MPWRFSGEVTFCRGHSHRGVLSAFLAFLVGLSCLRLKGVYFSIFTFGLSELILYSVLFYEMEVSGTVGRLVVGMDEKWVYYAMLVVMLILLIAVDSLGRSKYGLALQSIGEAEQAAACMGVNVNGVKVYTFTFSAFFMGLAGGMMVTQWTYVDSRTAFNMFYSFMPALMAIFGGLKKIRGQIVGAIVLTLLAESLLIKFLTFTCFCSVLWSWGPFCFSQRELSGSWSLGKMV